MKNPYEDMLHLPHPEPKKHKRMSIHDRAAQFSPFAALTGYEAVIQETGRYTDRDFELAEDGMRMLDEALRSLEARLEEGPEVSVTWFVPDDRKSGGAYRAAAGRVRDLDRMHQILLLEDGTRIPFGRILEIEAMDGG